jgi:hypothetical protein
MAQEWQRAFVNSELGYDPTAEDLALIEDAQRRPWLYAEDWQPKQAKPSKSRKLSRPYRLPYTIV